MIKTFGAIFDQPKNYEILNLKIRKKIMKKNKNKFQKIIKEYR